MAFRKEIERLYEIEYGHWRDLGFRFGAVLATAITLYLYTGWERVPVWLGLHFLGQLAHFLFLRNCRHDCTPRDVAIAGTLYCLLVANFLWLPAQMLVSTDPALRVGGAAALGAMLVFLIHRSDQVLGIVLGELAVIAGAMAWIVLSTCAQVTDPGAKFGLYLAGGGLFGYFTNTMLTQRRRRLEAEAAAQRSLQAQKMQAIGQLAGGVAHDFNNILTAVIGNLDLYDVLENPCERDGCVQEARGAALRAADLVRQLLAYARRSPMQIAAHDVGGLLGQLQTLTRRLIPTSIAQRFLPPSSPLSVAVDQTQFLTALVNLVVNARDAMPDGGRLEVRAQTVDVVTPRLLADGSSLAPGPYAEITVADTGPGIPPEILRRITEPFFTTKGPGQGSGLGLSMVEGFARQSGGALVIASTPSGTEMALLLPLAETPGPAFERLTP